MSPRSRRAFLGAFATGAAALAGCSLPGTDEQTTRTLTASLVAGTRVAAETPNGRVTAEPGGDELTVEATLRAPTRDHFDAVEVRVTTDDGWATIEPVFDADRVRRETEVALALSVPAGHPVGRVATGNGRVTVEATPGDLTAASGNGAVTAREVGGTVSLETGNGDVTAEDPGALGRAVTGNGSVTVDVPALGRADVRARSGNGDVTAALAPSLSARVEASTGNGDVTVSGLDFVDVSRTNRSFSGTLGGGEKQFRATTGNGDVVLSAL